MQNEERTTGLGEIGVKDILSFFIRNKWRIVLGGVAGALLSTAHVLTTPKRYEASLQLQMAQLANGNSEDPAALIQRLRTPTAYPPGVRQACGVQADADIKDYLGGILKVDLVKNVPNSVEMKIRAFSPEQAKQCAEVIVAMVVAQQRRLIEERLAGRQEQLLQYQQAMQAEQQQLKKIEKTELGNFGYLTILDKLSWLRTRMDALQEEALLSQLHPARLVTPIYASSKPVAPKVRLLLALGAMLGLMSGVLYAMGRDRWRKAA